MCQVMTAKCKRHGDVTLPVHFIQFHLLLPISMFLPLLYLCLCLSYLSSRIMITSPHIRNCLFFKLCELCYLFIANFPLNQAHIN